MNWFQRINPAWFLAGAAFFLPIKPVPVNVLLGLAVLTSVFSANHRQTVLVQIKRIELLPLWLLLAFMLLTFFYESNSSSGYNEFLSKYGRLALIPIIASMLANKEDRGMVAKAFLAGMALVLGMSYLIWIGLDPAWLGAIATNMYAIPSNPTVFKSHITHNFFLVIAIYFWMVCLLQALELKAKLFYGALVLLGLINLFGMIDGRTGWFVFMVIPLFFGYQKYGLRGLLAAGLCFVFLFFLGYYFLDNINQRVVTTWIEVQQVLQNEPRQGTSIGERVVYLSASWSAFLEAPLFGYGAGGIENAVEPFAKALQWPVFYNPHNQFLMFMLQGGLLALILYLWFFGAAVFQSARTNRLEPSVLPLLMIYFVGNLLNSFHFDFAESVGFLLVYAAFLGSSKQAELKCQ